jgi:hypothetical protein
LAPHIERGDEHVALPSVASITTVWLSRIASCCDTSLASPFVDGAGHPTNIAAAIK